MYIPSLYQHTLLRVCNVSILCNFQFSDSFLSLILCFQHLGGWKKNTRCVFLFKFWKPLRTEQLWILSTLCKSAQKIFFILWLVPLNFRILKFKKNSLTCQWMGSVEAGEKRGGCLNFQNYLISGRGQWRGGVGWN